MHPFHLLHSAKKGQGLIEYALILVLVAIVVIAILLTLGPVVGQVFSNVTVALVGTPTNIITGVSAVRLGNSPNVRITVNVSTSTYITISDSNNAVNGPSSGSCSGSCIFKVTTDNAGTVTAIASAGSSGSASYPAR